MVSHQGTQTRNMLDKELFTVCDGAAELQQAAEGERGYVSFAPAARLLLHILLKLDPARSLLPAHFMVLDDQLVQLHKQLRREQSRGCSAAWSCCWPAPSDIVTTSSRGVVSPRGCPQICDLNSKHKYKKEKS